MDQPTSRRPAGRAVLQDAVSTAIEEAAFAELAEVGYGGLRMESVARRAGVGKAALYRRWPSKEPMVVELLSAATRGGGVLAPDTGTLAGDVEAYLRGTRAQLRHPIVARIVGDLVGESVRSSVLADAVRAAVAGPRRAAASAMLTRAVERGELSADHDIGLAIDLMIAPVSFRALLMESPADEDDYLRRLTVATVAAMQAALL